MTANTVTAQEIAEVFKLSIKGDVVAFYHGIASLGGAHITEDVIDEAMVAIGAAVQEKKLSEKALPFYRQIMANSEKMPEITDRVTAMYDGETLRKGNVYQAMKWIMPRLAEKGASATLTEAADQFPVLSEEEKDLARMDSLLETLRKLAAKRAKTAEVHAILGKAVDAMPTE